MKTSILFEENLSGKRNLIGRRLHNRILRGGDDKYWLNEESSDVLEILSPVMTIRKLPNRRDMKLLGSDGVPVTSSFGSLYEGVTNDGKDHVVIKVPKSMRFVRDLKKWQKEVELAQIFGAENIGPRVLLANTHPRRIPFMVIQKFGVDLFDEVNNVLEKNYDAKRLEEEGHRIRNAIDGLIDNIARYRDKGGSHAVCFGDFRFENIVIQDTVARQIDFDFCYALPDKVDTRMLMRLALNFTRDAYSARVMANLFPPAGRIFGNTLWESRDDVLAQLDIMCETMRPEQFSILANKMFDVQYKHLRKRGGEFLNALKVYYRAASQEEAERVTFTREYDPECNRSLSPSSVAVVAVE